MENEKIFHWAIMCDSMMVESWACKAIELLFNEPGQKLTVIIIRKKEVEKKISFIQKILHYPYRHFLFRVFKRFLLYNDAYIVKNLDCLINLQSVKVISCGVEKKGASEYFFQNDIDIIRRSKLDFILKIGFGIIKGDILTSTEYGIWSYHHDDEQRIRGGPPGFWEIYKRHYANGILLQQLTSRLDAGKLIQKSFVPVTHHSYRYHINFILNESSVLLKKAFLSLKTDPVKFKFLPDIKTEASLYKLPSNIIFVLFYCKLILNKISFHYTELFETEFWKIGVAETSLENFQDFEKTKSRISWIKSYKPHGYLADPFIYSVNDREYILAEEYDYRMKKACITRIALDNYKERDVAIEETFHLSYPYIFKDADNHIYCLPEASQDNSVRLYELDSKSNSFKFKKKILENFPAIDPTLFFHNNTYWLFCTKEEECYNTYLYLFYSDSLDGFYTAHPQNPIVTDMHTARPAGNLFIAENKLIRPAQDCSKTYGWRVLFLEITKLTKQGYAEKEVFKIDSESVGKFRGIHTFAGNKMSTVIDVKYYRFSFVNFKNILLQKLKNVTGRNK